MADQSRTVHLVDDDPSIRRSASFMLRNAGFLVKTYPSGVTFLESVHQLIPGCILLDVRMPDMDGLEVQKELRKRHILLPVIVMTGHGDVAVAVEAMKRGAVDFIEKPFEKSVLIAALEDSFERLERSDRRRIGRKEAQARLRVLTSRELDVLSEMAQANSNKAIARNLGISPRTVEIHRANVMGKLGVASLSEALRVAFTAGIGDGEQSKATD